MNAIDQRTKSIWMQTSILPDAPAISGAVVCDTLVVGAGIAGLSVAYALAKAGQKVVVIDRGAICGGMTSRTTAHLAPVCDDLLSELIALRGQDMAHLFQESQESAVDSIEANIRELEIECDFRRLEGYLFPAIETDEQEGHEQCGKEQEAAEKAGAEVNLIIGVPFEGLENVPALEYPNQATFHPLKYLDGLSAALRSLGGLIFADSPVLEVKEEKHNVQVRTDNGSITAAHAVFATNSPINNRVELHSKMAPYRTYAMAFELPRGSLPDALYWDMADPYHYVRLQPGTESSDVLIVGGEDHKSGEAADGEQRFRQLESWMRRLLPALGAEITRWSGQVLDTMDYCGFIGRNPGNDRIFVATGDSGQGMTHGALAGILLRDLIVDVSSPWEELYDPSRKTPAAAMNFIKENMTAIKNFAEYVTPGELGSPEDLAPGDGAIIRDGLHKVAACRDRDGHLHLHSASCTHLGCIVHWNPTEQCWDCPCHGSQFAPNGEVLNGPAIKPLEAAQPPVTRQRAAGK